MEQCYYCENGETMHKLMEHIADVGNAGVYLFRDQTHKGKCIVVYNKEHVTEWYQLSEDEQAQFIQAMAKTAKVLAEIFHPDKINYATYGDKVSHLHVHVVPKYENGPDWGVPFRDNRPPTILKEEIFQRYVSLIKEKISC